MPNCVQFTLYTTWFRNCTVCNHGNWLLTRLFDSKIGLGCPSYIAINSKRRAHFWDECVILVGKMIFAKTVGTDTLVTELWFSQSKIGLDYLFATVTMATNLWLAYSKVGLGCPLNIANFKRSAPIYACWEKLFLLKLWDHFGYWTLIFPIKNWVGYSFAIARFKRAAPIYQVTKWVSRCRGSIIHASYVFEKMISSGMMFDFCLLLLIMLPWHQIKHWP